MSTALQFLVSAGLLASPTEELRATAPLQDTAPDASVDSPDSPARQGLQVVFLNFQGATLTYSQSDYAPGNETQFRDYAGTWGTWGSGAQRQTVLDTVRNIYDPYNVRVQDTRPESGEYSMVMIGNNPSAPSSPAGWSAVACGNRNRTTISFANPTSRYSAQLAAYLVAHELGHSFGLDHVDNADRMMNSTVFTDATLGTRCERIDGSGLCRSDHEAYCGSGDQNSHEELLNTLGEAIVDSVAPEVVITSPDDGVEIGPDFTVVAMASDDNGLDMGTLLVDGAPMDSRPWGGQAFAWDIAGAPAGVYVFEVEVLDLAGNQGRSQPVTVTVVEPEGPGSSTGGGDGDSGGDPPGDGDGDGDGSGDGDGDGDGDGSGDGDGDGDSSTWSGGSDGDGPGAFDPGSGPEGCACRGTAHGTVPAWLWVPCLLLARGRRRSVSGRRATEA